MAKRSKTPRMRLRAPRSIWGILVIDEFFRAIKRKVTEKLIFELARKFLRLNALKSARITSIRADLRSSNGGKFSLKSKSKFQAERSILGLKPAMEIHIFFSKSCVKKKFSSI